MLLYRANSLQNLLCRDVCSAVLFYEQNYGRLKSYFDVVRVEILEFLRFFSLEDFGKHS